MKSNPTVQMKMLTTITTQTQHAASPAKNATPQTVPTNKTCDSPTGNIKQTKVNVTGN